MSEHSAPLTVNDVLEFARWIQVNEEAKQRVKNGTLLDLVMMNGKRLRDCTGHEVGEEVKRMKEIADRIDAIKTNKGRLR